MIEEKVFEAEGEAYYDFENDILFFKAKDREYSRSLEFNPFVIDIDTENNLVGVQVFDASKLFMLPKSVLMHVKDWQFKIRIEGNELRMDLIFKVEMRGKTIEKNPMLFKSLEHVELPDSRMLVRA